MIDTATLDAPLAARTCTRQPRLGFAGVGWIGRNRLDALVRTGIAEATAIVDPAVDDDDSLWRETGAQRLERYEDLLEAGLDGIVIATPNALHASQAIQALECGIPVFCQKPLGRDSAETSAVISAARSSDRLLGVDLSYRHTAGMQAIRQEISAGRLGKIMAVEAIFHNAYGPDKPWFYHRSEAGGGCLLDLGIHLVDLALWCLDYPSVVSVSGWVGGGEEGGDCVESHAKGHLLLDGNLSMSIATSWRSSLACDAEISLRFFGSEGTASFYNLEGSFYDFSAQRIGKDRQAKLLAAPADDWGGRAATEWARRLGISPAFDADISRLQDVAQVIDKLYASARTA